MEFTVAEFIARLQSLDPKDSVEVIDLVSGKFKIQGLSQEASHIQPFIHDYVYLECDERFKSEEQVNRAKEFINDECDFDEIISEEGTEEAQCELIHLLNVFFEFHTI